MKPASTIRLTSDELTAIAHRLGTTLFPGVRANCFDAVDPELHPLLDNSFLMSLVARDLLAPDADGMLWPAEELATLIGAVASHQVHLTVEQTMPATHPEMALRWEVMAGAAGVVQHLVDDPIHHFEVAPASSKTAEHAAELAQHTEAAVTEIVHRSPGAGAPGRRQRWGPKSRLAEIVPAPEGGWRRSTLLTRADADERARVEGFLRVLDGGPGQLWLVHDDTGTDDDTVVAAPASSSDVDAALRAFVAAAPR